MKTQKVTIHTLRAMKERGDRITMLTGIHARKRVLTKVVIMWPQSSCRNQLQPSRSSLTASAAPLRRRENRPEARGFWQRNRRISNLGGPGETNVTER